MGVKNDTRLGGHQVGCRCVEERSRRAD